MASWCDRGTRSVRVVACARARQRADGVPGPGALNGTRDYTACASGCMGQRFEPSVESSCRNAATPAYGGRGCTRFCWIQPLTAAAFDVSRLQRNVHHLRLRTVCWLPYQPFLVALMPYSCRTAPSTRRACACTCCATRRRGHTRRRRRARRQRSWSTCWRCWSSTTTPATQVCIS